VLEVAGCDIVRCARPGPGRPPRSSARSDARSGSRWWRTSTSTTSWRSSRSSRGVDGLRLNPGNIGGKAVVQESVNVAKRSGSDPHRGQRGVAREGSPREARRAQRRGMVESASVSHPDPRGLKLSGDENLVKASDPLMMIEPTGCWRQVDYAFHLGSPEAGTPRRPRSVVRSAWRGSSQEGTATDRVSLSAIPPRRSASGSTSKIPGAPEGRTDIVSCPSCGRADVDLVKPRERGLRTIQGAEQEIHIAGEGCEVNGPGEARAANIGVAEPRDRVSSSRTAV